jgi:iron complex outermembrane receptor protein
MGGSANSLGGGAAGVQFGAGDWLLWGDVGGQRTSDYNTPIGEIFNSSTRGVSGGGGLGRYTNKNFFNFSFVTEDSVYFIPPVEDETVHLSLRRYSPQFTGGFQNLDSPIEGVRLTLNYSDYHHEELTDENEAETLFDNNVFSYRGVFNQRRTGRLTGSFGFSGLHRDYETTGAEALAPPVTQDNVAFFTLQTVSLERFRLQFGGRVDHTAYNLVPEPPQWVNRSFTGFSGAAGINVPLWSGGAFVANYTHSYRAPALEELYNNGAHPGNQTFEIGNANLSRERSDGLDLSLKQRTSRVRAEANFFYYRINDFVFLAPTGNINDDLIEAEYLQADSRFLGGEANVDVALHDYFSVNSGLDIVRAELKSSVTSPSTGTVTPSGTPLPRIPPLRGRVGLDFHYRGLSLRPGAVIADAQEQFFVTESRTAGYSVFNLNASYTIARQHSVQVFSVSAFNLGDRLYRNHLSFIKDIAPEIGRGVRVAYTVRFF